MPTYTYRCEGCERVAEANHAMNAQLTPVCAECGGIMRRVIVTPPAVHGEKKIDHAEDVAEDTKEHHGSACVLHYHDDCKHGDSYGTD